MQEQLRIPIKEQYITGSKFYSTKFKYGLLVVHGWTSSNKKYLKLAEDLARHNFLVIAINLRGHGDSPFPLHTYSRQDHLDDIKVSYDYLKNLLGKEQEICVLGKSYGGYLSSIATTMRKIDRLILSQPALYPNSRFGFSNQRLIAENPNIFRSTTEIPEDNRALLAVAKFKNPILLVESERDAEVPKKVTDLYLKAASKNNNLTHKIIKNADHSLSVSSYLDDFYSIVKEWLDHHNH